nr:MAG: RNA-dependent RNA polymerase [Porcine picobirnavirus]
MKVEKIPAQLALLVLKNSAMSSYLDNLSVGRKATPHSWLYENEDEFTTLERWIPIMEKANLRNSPYGEEFIQFDRKQLSKFGPQGEVPPIESPEAQEVIEPLFTPSKYDDENALSQYFPQTKEFATVLFGKRLKTKRPLSIESVTDDMNARDTLTTNSGFPRFARRKTVKEEEINDAKSGKAFDYPAIILFRQYYGKLRPVWMYPMSMNLIELRYEIVLQQSLRKSPTAWVSEYVTPWTGYDEVKVVLTQQWHGEQVDGGDTTKMDAHMRRAQMRLFYEIVKWQFQESSWEELYHAIMRCCEIPLLVSKSTWIPGPHGLASGAGFTQMSETVLQLFMAWCNATYGQGIGDDFYWLTGLDADELVAALEKFGLPANPTKQGISDTSLTFLQRMNRQGFFSRDNPAVLGAYYPTIRALGSSLRPEKFHRPKDWSKDMFAIRQFMIAENCVDDPCFVEFLTFLLNGHAYLREFAKKSARDLNRIQKQARLIPGLNPSYNQEKRAKPLSEFTIIKLARTL